MIQINLNFIFACFICILTVFGNSNSQNICAYENNV